MPAKRLDDAGGHRGPILKEGTEETRRGQLHGIAEPVVITALVGDGSAVGIVQMKVARDLVGRGVPVIATVALALQGTQETDRHEGDLRLLMGGCANDGLRNETSSA